MDTPKENLRHWPMPMARYGLNPYGDNLYRIVFAPSRRYVVYGQWPDGSQKARWLPKYPEVGESWVLERWLTPFEYARCTPEEWNRELTILGPYPDRGEYEICHKFNLVTPDNESITKLIELIEQSHKDTRRNGNVFENPANTAACLDMAERDQAATSSQMQALIGNALPAFGYAPMSGPGGARGTKTRPVIQSAQEAGLPVMPRGERGKHISRSTLVSGDRLIAQP
jgi:hypothetical protein